MDNKKKKEFVVPEAEIVEFAKEDIIATSDRWWNGTGDNNEPWPFQR